MKRIIEIIAEDEELEKLLMDAFKWRGHGEGMMADCQICKLADKIFEKYNREIEAYT